MTISAKSASAGYVPELGVSRSSKPGSNTAGLFLLHWPSFEFEYVGAKTATSEIILQRLGPNISPKLGRVNVLALPQNFDRSAEGFYTSQKRQLVAIDRKELEASLRRSMSVLLETSLGDIVIDLLVESAPKCCEKYIELSFLPSSITQLSKLT